MDDGGVVGLVVVDDGVGGRKEEERKGKEK
jgi:hypothetical protein